jgi:hypothetical protein
MRLSLSSAKMAAMKRTNSVEAIKQNKNVICCCANLNCDADLDQTIKNKQ